MTSIEERLRDAIRATAATVDEHKHRPPPVITDRRSRAWLTPVAVAVAVVTAITGASAIARRYVAAGPATGSGMPRFLVTTDTESSPGHLSRLLVEDTATGRVSDVRTMPMPVSFRYVAAGPDQTFYVLTEATGGNDCAIDTFQLKVSAVGRIIRFAKLSGGDIPHVTVTPIGGIAISPDGHRIAYAYRACSSERGTPGIGVLDIRSGTWQRWRDGGSAGISSLSWTADGRYLAYLFRDSADGQNDGPPVNGTAQMRLLDTKGAHRVLPAGAVLLRESKRLPYIWGALVSPDGKRIIVAAQDRPVTSSAYDGVFSVQQVRVGDGSPVGPLYRSRLGPAGTNPVLAGDISGLHLLLCTDRMGWIDTRGFHRIPGDGPCNGLAW
ncbi:hypothetical protein GCM10027176_13320 [Actinoallomurus bryophytorum]|uniref:Prolyl oligopeptidase family protein n=1 Tax=Actinoallomurus bryophytorum TaxID=1490222 RepID=A0A543CQU2_9ACTN|nr:hypothetical protein [Actinoallomurus bryophytorum]TQL99297.1 prolyl oligopeptidase family protein [Actinoallomurus bryophytorum]